MSSPFTRRNRTRRDRISPRIVAGAGLAVGLVLLAIVVFALQSPNGLPLRSYHDLNGVVPDAGNLQPHNEVRVRGVRVGQVLRVQSQGRMARIEFRLDPGSGAVPADSAVAVRARGLLGQRYLEIVPGRSRQSAADGATLRGGPDALTFGVPEVLDTFDAETRGGLRDTVGGLGEGLAARGSGLNDALRVMPEGEHDARRLIRTILARRDAARTLVPSLDGAAAALDASRWDLTALLRPADRAAQVFADERAAVRATLSALPPTLDAALPALRDGRGLLGAVNRLARSVDRTLPTAPAALRATSALLHEAHTPLRRTTILLGRAQTAIPPTLRLTDAARPLLAPIDDALGNLRTIVRTVGPYGCELVNLGDNWHSALGYGKEEGFDFGPVNNFRITAIAGPDAVSGVGKTLTPDALMHKTVYPAPCATSPGKPYTGDLIAGGAR